MKATFKGEVILLWLILLAACAPAPMVDTQVLSLFQGATANTMAHPEFVAVLDDVAIAARPITSGNGSGPILWAVACANGQCPAVPGTAMTAAALSQFFNELAARGFQVYSRASALLRVPLVVPVTPAMFEMAEPMEMD
jgi:hypothetical protein